MKKIEQADRVSHSFGMKISIGQYSTADFHLSLSSDVKDGETIEEAMDRVKSIVEERAEKEYEEISSLKADREV